MARRGTAKKGLGTPGAEVSEATRRNPTRAAASTATRAEAVSADGPAQDLFRTLADSTPAGIYLTDAGGDCTYANRRWLEMAGLSLDEALGTGWMRGLHPDDRETIGEKWYRAAQSDGRWGFEYRFAGDGGRVTWVWGTAAALRDANGAVAGYVGTNIDITERKLAEESLSASEERLRSVISSAHDAIIVKEASGRIVHWNSGAERIFGVTTDQAVGQTSTSRDWHLIREDGSEYPGEQHPSMRTFATGEPVENELLGVRGTGGKVVWLSVSTSPLFRNGEKTPYAVVVTCADVTARRTAEESLRNAQRELQDLFASLGDGLSVLDADGVHLDVNPAFCAMTGFSRDELVGTGPPHPYWPPEQLPTIGEALAAARAGGSQSFELTFMRKDGDRFPVIVSPSTVRDEKGRVVRTVATVKDITELKRARDELAVSREHYRLLFDNANDAVYVFRVSRDGMGRFLEVNERACEMFGYTREELLELEVSATDVPEHADRVPDRLAQLWKTGRAVFETEKVAKDGHRVPVEVSARVFDLEGVPTILSTARDISERKQAEKALRASEERYATVADFTWDWEYWRDPDGIMVYSSPSCERITGYSAAEFLADPGLLTSITHPEDRDAVATHIRERPHLEDTGCHIEFRVTTRSGETCWIGHECQRVFGRDGNLIGVRGSNRDISAQREAAERLKESEELFRSLFDTMTSGCAIYEVRGDGSRGADYIVKDFNAASLRLEGKTKEEVVGRSLADLRPAIDDYGLIPVFQRVWQTGEPASLPSTIYVDDRYSNWYENRVFKLSSGEIAAIYDDVTERKRAEEERRLSEERLDLAIKSAAMGTWDWDIVADTNQWDEITCGFYGADPRAGQVGASIESFLSVVHPEDREDIAGAVRAAVEIRAPYEVEFRVLRPDGSVRYIAERGHVHHDEAGRAVRMIGVSWDVTARHKAEEAARESERFARSTLNGLSAHIAIVGESGTIVAVNQAWRDFAAENPPIGSKVCEGADYFAVCDRASGEGAGAAGECAAGMRAVLAGDERMVTIEYPCHAPAEQRWFVARVTRFPGDGPACVVVAHENITKRIVAQEAVRETAAILANAEQVAHVGSWRYELATGRTTWSDEMFRLFDWDPADFSGDSWPILQARVHPDDFAALAEASAKAVAAAEPTPVEYRLVLPDGRERIVRGEGSVERDEAGQAVALSGYYQDVTRRRRAVEELRATLRATVQALGAVGALRDPYTGDHESRVAELADAIAAEMDLEADRREGLRMAAEVHDVGKVGVPAEILSKPGRLSEVEFSLVKQHPQRGCDILATIPFRWPVAEVVLQHHERLDGSGYPRGLAGDEILLEARILTVADVVEAMASHRPYRPALGLDLALDEIRRGAGTRYDAAVAAACEKAFATGAVSLTI